MSKRPAHLTVENASRFKDPGLVDVYHHRLPHPPETFTMLLDLIQDEPRTVLDVGTGTGVLARPLAALVDRVDAVDFSAAMIARGKTLPGGDAPNLRWLLGRVEEVPLDTRYSLIVGGDSLHWMDWDVVFPKFADHLAPNGVVALVGRSEKPPAWQEGLMALIKRYSLYQNYVPYNLGELLQERKRFTVQGEAYTPYHDSTQSVDDYVASFHSRGSLSPDALPEDHVATFDQQLRALIEPYAENGHLALQTRAKITWGYPLK